MFIIENIKRIKNVILLFAGVCAFASCSKEPEHEKDDTFAGKDNYITAFGLQQGATVFNAAIAGDEITLTVPEGFSLTKAKATVTLSENATIYPDPSTVTEWNDERQFVVTAYNGAQYTYIYKVSRSGIAHSGSVILETQADVDAFGQQGITLIDGNLTIGRATGTDSITSLAPLSALKGVAYTLTLNNACAITDLTGLDNLEQVGGVIQIGALKHLEILTLPKLKTAGSINVNNTVTFIVELPELTSVSKLLSLTCPLYQLQLSGLKYAGALTLTAGSVKPSLAIVSLPALEEAGNITISNLSSVAKIELPKLRKSGSLGITGMTLLSFVYAPKLEEVAEGINLSSLTSLMEFSLPELKQAATIYIACALRVLEIPKLTGVNTLTLNTVQTNGLEPFKALQTAGKVILSDATGTGRMEIPASLRSIDVLDISIGLTRTPPSEIDVRGKAIGELIIRNNAMKAKIVGDGVFRGTLNIFPNAADNTFPELVGLDEIDSLRMVSNNMDTLQISGIRKVNKGVHLTTSYSAYPKKFTLSDMEEVGGDLTINFPYMTYSVSEVISLDKLKSVGGNFNLTLNTDSATILNCPELTTVAGDFSLSACCDYSRYRSFETLNFSKLTTVGGKLTIHSGIAGRNNTRLKNLDGFAALRSVKAIEITRMGAIESYKGLKEAVKSLSPDDWSATDNAFNPSLQDLLDGKYTNE